MKKYLSLVAIAAFISCSPQPVVSHTMDCTTLGKTAFETLQAIGYRVVAEGTDDRNDVKTLLMHNGTEWQIIWIRPNGHLCTIDSGSSLELKFEEDA